MAESDIEVEVVHAEAGRQHLLRLSVAVGTNMRDAVLRSGMQTHFPALDLHDAPLGIFGKLVPKPQERVLEAGERIEIYRPLLADPKEVRKQRAARAKARTDGTPPSG